MKLPLHSLLKGILFLIAFPGGPLSGSAQSIEQIRLPGEHPFVFSLGAGYGISNNPCRECKDNKSIGGVTIAFSLGCRINERMSIGFGPSFWIEGDDLGNKNVAESARPNNKRTIITFSAAWKPLKNIPLTTRFGAGVGLLNYTPKRSTVTADESTFDETEIFKGFSAIAGIGYAFHISNKWVLQPGFNFWYLRMQDPKINYHSFIDPSRPSFTGEFRMQLDYNF